MPTKLEQVATLLGNMTKVELYSVKSMAAQLMTLLPETTKCHFLDLPVELREIIYIFAGINHLRAYGNTKDCGFFGVNKQIRIEFMDIFYSKKVVIYLHSGVIDLEDFKTGRTTEELKYSADKKSLKALIDGDALLIPERIGISGDSDTELGEDVRNNVQDYSHGWDSSWLVIAHFILNSSDDARAMLSASSPREVERYGLGHSVVSKTPTTRESEV